MGDRVAEVEADVVADLDAGCSQRVRESGRALVELRVDAPVVAAHHRLAFGHRVGDALEQVGDVELHAARSPRVRNYCRILSARRRSGGPVR